MHVLDVVNERGQFRSEDLEMNRKPAATVPIQPLLADNVQLGLFLSLVFLNQIVS